MLKEGRYKISLCRFPLESGLGINAVFPQAESCVEIEGTRPASVKSDFMEASLYFGPIRKKLPIEANNSEVIFEGTIPEGKYDMIAELIDQTGKTYPAYYIYQ